MHKIWPRLAREYESALRAYLASGGEAHLQKAYELGRTGLGRGLGVLDMVRLHQVALIKIYTSSKASMTLQNASSVETFLLEAMTPFEAAHRGFRDTSTRFGVLNETLKQRNKELAATNKILGEEIASRAQIQQQLAGAQRLAHLGSFEYNLTTGNVKWSDELYRIYGLSPRKYKPGPESVLALVHPADRKRAKRLIDDAVRRRESFALECRIIRPDKKIRTLYTQGEVSGGRKGESLRLVGFSQDITARKQTEDDLRESRGHYFRLFQQAHEMEENLRLLSNRIISAQEEERKRISHELHAEIGQALTAVNVGIELFKKHLVPNHAFAEKATSAQKLLEQSMETVHHFARELQPSVLEDLGLQAALRSYLKSFSERTGIKAMLQTSEGLRRLDSQQEIVLYRVAQESLTNVFKHAHATRVEVRFVGSPQSLRMDIRDNGRSFFIKKQPNGRISPRHLGLLGMQERVRLINGQFSIFSTPGHGTTVSVQIPFNSKHHNSESKEAAFAAIPPVATLTC
jgi:signal transduction histidine kinase